jgi:tetratricopeptide (TPR) repeat protein
MSLELAMSATEDPPSEAERGHQSPLEIMRSWHPDLFSDSECRHEPIIPRDVLDYQLETLTNRKQETEFEYFARELAEREICPNLRPQTGPTGGGDSKADSETYPVAPELALRWYQGEPEAAGERWAFAFSAKKKWRDKARSDVGNIVSTGRPYRRIFFITNQYAPEKPRAGLEDELTVSTGVPVTILDRSWLLEKIYANDRLELAIRTLNLTGYEDRLEQRFGPRDTARLAELERLDAAVADTARYRGAPFNLAQDALQSALLARGLERPRSEIEGRFLMAARIAENTSESQRLRIAYNRAWTAYWWFDDLAEFNRLYDEVAPVALASDNCDETELLLNLWQLLLPAAHKGAIAKDQAKLRQRHDALDAALTRIAANSARPNNAAQARTAQLFMRASAVISQRRLDDLPAVWEEMRELLTVVEGLGDYPLERTYEMIVRVGEYVPESEAFDALFEDMVAFLEKHRSEAEGGIAYLRRGNQKLDKGLYYDAIRMYGLAETKLIKAEYLDELVEALVGIADAYRRAGLRWAARAKALFAADRLLLPFHKGGSIDPRAAVPLKFLAWLELELGRVPQALAAYELYRMIVAITEQPEGLAAKVADELQMQEAILGMLLMRAGASQLKALEQAPDMLESQGLVLARGGLLWALGGAEAVRSDGFAPADQNDEEIAEFFRLWEAQPAAEQIPSRPFLGESDELELSTVILGVEVVARVARGKDSLVLAEAILAALESFLSTSLGEEVFPYRERMTFTVRPADDGSSMPVAHVDDLTRAVAITHGEGMLAGAADYPAFTDWLQEVLVHLTLGMLVVTDVKQWLERVAKDEAGFGRALALSGVGLATSNIFGNDPKMFIADWIDPSAKRYPSRVRQNDPAPEAKGPLPSEPAAFRFARGELPEDWLDPEARPHHERGVVSVINLPLWDRASWRATGFSWDPGAPPLLMLGFEDYEAGQAIFREWRERFSEVDQAEELRISIVRGIDRSDPHAYTVMISSECGAAERSGKLFLLAARCNRMTPTSSDNLDRFLEAYARAGSYGLAALAFTGAASFGAIDPELIISKRRLFVREAWTIGEQDPELICIDPDDDPIIPAHVADPPIAGALQFLRTRKKHA